MKTKMLALFAVVVLATALAGTAYAQWTATVTVNGSINFGTLKMVWSDVFPQNDIIKAAWANEAHTAVTVNINNAYPGMVVDLTLQTQNTGTLPLKYDSFEVTNDVDDRIDDMITLAFLRPDLTPNVQGTLEWFETPRTYAEMGIDAQYITFGSGVTHNNPIRITIGDIPAEWQGYSLAVTFALTAVPATE